MKRIRMRCFLSLFLVFLIGGMLVTYAWLSLRWNSGLSMLNFSAGTSPPPAASMWLYSTELEENDPDKLGWVEYSLTEDEQDPHLFRLPQAQSVESEGIYTFELKSLHLGTVDNLVIMNQDNIVCLRFCFNSEVHGNSVAMLTADLSDSLGRMLHLYNSDGVEITDARVYSELETIHAQTPFLQYQGCVSSQKLSPSEDAFAELPFSEETLFGESVDLYENAEPLEGEYYVYIKIMPNLSAIAPASELLNAYMPCVVLFDAEIQATVH